jgi:hypothetical protein
MKNTDIHNWEDFEKEIKKLHDYRDGIINKTKMGVSEPIFRGQSDSTWELLATLDRFTNSELRLEEYHKIILAAKPQIESFLNKQWDVRTLKEYVKWVEKLDFLQIEESHIPDYQYMVFLRHHGFPSPLLDWTSSPYIAAFFAFNNTAKNIDSVSIYAYIEYAGVKMTDGDKPWISTLGHYIKTHERHFLQQCSYTRCTKMVDQGAYYAKHEDVFSINAGGQDLLWKFNLPVSQRVNFLKRLDAMNINSFGLFRSEDGLMDTMAKREILFRDI